MLFPTLSFGIFFLIVFAIAWELSTWPQTRKAFLVAVSYVFYGFWDWRFTALLATSSLINYAAGRLLAITVSDKGRRQIVVAAIALNLGILGFFKYYGFFMESLSDLLTRVGLERDLPFLEIILPIGISFFTFHGISYVVDVYRGKIPAEESPLDVFLYISFFPQLVAGPIVRASDFLPQLKTEPRLERSMVANGIMLILIGLFKLEIPRSTNFVAGGAGVSEKFEAAPMRRNLHIGLDGSVDRIEVGSTGGAPCDVMGEHDARCALHQAGELFRVVAVGFHGAEEGLIFRLVEDVLVAFLRDFEVPLRPLPTGDSGEAPGLIELRRDALD